MIDDQNGWNIFLVSVHLIHHLMQPSPEFISHSYKLRQNPEIERFVAAVVEITIDNYRGTGFNIDEKGLIVTNYHLINHDGVITVIFATAARERSNSEISGVAVPIHHVYD